MSWSLFRQGDSAWDAVVSEHAPQSPFQSSSWSSFRAVDGWTPVRLATADSTSAVQFLVKQKSKHFTIGWSAGGLLGSFTAEQLSQLPGAMQEILDSRLSYLRISDFGVLRPEGETLYHDAGWEKCRFAISSSNTLIRQLSTDLEVIRTTYSANWSRNLRRGEQRQIRCEQWKSPDYQLMADIYNEVVDLKKSFRADWRADPNRLSQFVESFGDALYQVRATSPDGTTLAYRAAVTFGTVGFDILAATRHEGRKCYASHVATHGLLELLGKAGCTRYDFGGVDRNNNSGVYNFKHGAGGSDHRYMGEWHISIPKPARCLIERVIKHSLSQGR